MKTPSSGVEPVSAARIAVATSGARVTNGGTKIAITASMSGSAATHSIVRRKSSAVADAIMSTGLPTAACAGSAPRSRARVVGRQRLDSQPGRGAGVDARDSGTARVRDHRDPIAGRQRLRREQRGDVELLTDGVGADDAGVVEQRVDRHVRGGQERAGVRGGGAGARGRAAALDRDDRLALGDSAGDLPEAARVAERLEVERDHVGLGVGCPVPQEVVAREVGLVAGGDERRQPQAAMQRLGDRRDAEPAALRAEGDPPGLRRLRREGRVEPAARREHPEAVGPDEPHSARAAGCRATRPAGARRSRRPPRTRPR